jgi:hypothetical protein
MISISDEKEFEMCSIFPNRFHRGRVTPRLLEDLGNYYGFRNPLSERLGSC